jgi:hypothetical protein
VKKKRLPRVTSKNYYDPEIQMAYMGSTQFKAFQKCEAAALAALRGQWEEKKTTALLVGGYVDAYFAKELDKFREDHPEIFSTKQPYGLKAEYKHAEKIIERMKQDKIYMMLMSGRKQVIRTGFIANVPFKIRIDCLLKENACKKIVEQFPETADAMGMCDGAIVDQKVMANFDNVWSEEDRMKVPFIEYWGYDTQGAIYQAIEGNMLPFIINGATKEAEPNLGAFYVSDSDLAARLAEVEDKAPRYQAIKDGEIEPSRCENCDYCRATRKLRTIVNYRELEDFEC